MHGNMFLPDYVLDTILIRAKSAKVGKAIYKLNTSTYETTRCINATFQTDTYPSYQSFIFALLLAIVLKNIPNLIAMQMEDIN
jgi:hypothetical protein